MSVVKRTLSADDIAERIGGAARERGREIRAVANAAEAMNDDLPEKGPSIQLRAAVLETLRYRDPRSMPRPRTMVERIAQNWVCQAACDASKAKGLGEWLERMSPGGPHQRSLEHEAPAAADLQRADREIEEWRRKQQAMASNYSNVLPMPLTS